MATILLYCLHNTLAEKFLDIQKKVSKNIDVIHTINLSCYY